MKDLHEIKSDLLGETILVALTCAAKLRALRDRPDVVCYSAREIDLIADATHEELRLLHAAKKALRARARPNRGYGPVIIE